MSINFGKRKFTVGYHLIGDYDNANASKCIEDRIECMTIVDAINKVLCSVRWQPIMFDYIVEK